MITTWEADILAHASHNDGRFVTADPRVLELAARGFFHDHGPWALAGGDHALRLSLKGREALAGWRAAQPKPKKRRVSEQFRSWERYQEACGRIPFSQFLKQVWPHRHEYR